MVTQVKTKLEAITNVTVIVVALVLGYAVLTRYAASDPAVPRSVTVGDHLPKVAGIDWNQHRRTLVLALNTGCHYCEESVPFYQKLAHQQLPDGDDLEMIAAFPNEAETVRQFAAHEALPIRTVAGVPLDKLGIVATPTLILVNREGRVERSWVGILSTRQELDLLKVTSGS
jgi:hypothetical protein